MSDPDTTNGDGPVRTALAQLRAVAQECQTVELPLLESTLNGAFSADPETLQLIARLVHHSAPRHVIALGCDASTELLALLGFAHGRMAVTVFEHDPWHAEAVIQVASSLAINYRWFSFCICPLVARICGGARRPVYDDGMVIPTVPYPADLVIITGPPAELGGRGGMIYQTLYYARPGTIVLVLNARRGEEAMFESWTRELTSHMLFVPPGFLHRHLAFVVREPIANPFSLEGPFAQLRAEASPVADSGSNGGAEQV